jgi:UDP-N-acetyl-D-glucosamine dehydrogenase
MLGIAYKKNVDDMRESPSVEIMAQLRDLGAQVEYCDPYVPKFPSMRRFDFDLSTVAFDADTLAQYDCVIIGCDHDLFDYDLVFAEAPLVVDTRGRAKHASDRVFRA